MSAGARAAIWIVASIAGGAIGAVLAGLTIPSGSVATPERMLYFGVVEGAVSGFAIAVFAAHSRWREATLALAGLAANAVATLVIGWWMAQMAA